jgi:DNA-binding NtrC family response regulator
MRINVLIVDDEEPARSLLTKELGRKGFMTDSAENGRIALKKLMASAFDVVLLDIVMPDMDGISLMKKFKTDPTSPAIVVLTGRATVDTAVEAMKNGAYDYLTKPYKLDELVIIVNRAYEQRKLRIENQLLQQELARKDTPDDFVGKSDQYRHIVSLVEKMAPTDSTVLIQGDSGTGKELVANYICRKSKRNDRPLIALNCSSLSESLMESELFGHEKGAFTNAYRVKHGLVESAHEGTLFLDEIGEISIGLQANLLRFLDSGEFRRVGGNKTMKTDVRVIAATNKNLADAIRHGKFRVDLFYRLNVLNIFIPPLRERKEDIEPLSDYFLRKYQGRIAKSTKGFAPGTMDIFFDYDWPGNVRELENVIERAVILCDSEVITPGDISVTQKTSVPRSDGTPSLLEIEKGHIVNVLNQTGGNQSKASRILGIDRKTLYLKLKKYGIAID